MLATVPGVGSRSLQVRHCRPVPIVGLSGFLGNLFPVFWPVVPCAFGWELWLVCMRGVGPSWMRAGPSVPPLCPPLPCAAGTHTPHWMGDSTCPASRVMRAELGLRLGSMACLFGQVTPSLALALALASSEGRQEGAACTTRSPQLCRNRPPFPSKLLNGRTDRAGSVSHGTRTGRPRHLGARGGRGVRYLE